MSDIDHVAVLGLGPVGVEFVEAATRAGRTVTVVETDGEQLRRGLEALADSMAAAVSAGALTEQARSEALDRVVSSTEPSELGKATLVLEAVAAGGDAKRAALREAAAVVGADVAIITVTSGQSVTELAAAVPDPARVVGLHVPSTGSSSRIVEVVRGLASGDAVVGAAADFVGSVEREPVVVDDRPGFLVDSMLLPYLNDVVQAYDDELASAEDIDVAIRLGLGHPVGPLEMLDRIGLDTHRDTTALVHEATGDARFAPPPLVNRMVAAGRLGDKNGRGFRSTEETA
ncbi:3-hydroxyacyl-CoA dehydrogenase family protein [Saccharomonospora sp. NPDC046836]|uniref:3-hydroxyacyl-CoA dehydrogenase family protein n=1 Tax=Saccharomonospora sp. NPDC046836 TaxID=3156921 RepID=UPI0033CD7754